MTKSELWIIRIMLAVCFILIAAFIASGTKHMTDFQTPHQCTLNVKDLRTGVSQHFRIENIVGPCMITKLGNEPTSSF